MTNANECTCPSGDGSLRHPCPAHPAPVEQAGGDERAAQWHECTCPKIGEKWNPAKHGKDCPVHQARAALAQPSPGQAEAERPEVVARVVHSNPVVLDQCAPLNANDELMTVAQHERIAASRWERAMDLMGDHVARISDKLTAERDAALAEVERLTGVCASLDSEKREMEHKRDAIIAMHDAALARVAELELKLDQSDYAYDNDHHHMRGMAKQAAEAIQVFTGHDSGANLAHRYGEKWWEHLDELRDALLAFAKNAPVAQPEEMPGEILAAKLIETWVTKHGKPAPWSTAVEITAVATNMPNDERDRLLALDDDVDAQAQHSVPEGVRELLEMLVASDLRKIRYAGAWRREVHDRASSILALLAAAPGKEGL
ncbi:hypothetical protein ACEP4D_00070 [Pseudomonas aeruginosa]